jgi:hypothetical protein
MSSTDTIPSIKIDGSIKPSDTTQVKVKEISHEIEPLVNMPVYILPHAFISSTIPTLMPANTTPQVENQIRTKPSEAPKGKEDIKVQEITREYMDKVLEEMARVEHDEETGGIETGNVKSLYEELFELKRSSCGWGWGSPPLPFVNEPVNFRNDGPRGSQIFTECRDETRMRMEAKKKAEAAKLKENLERAALVEAAEKQRADAPQKDTSGVIQTEDEDSLSVEASDKIQKWKWVFYTGDKGGEIKTKVPVSPRGTPIYYD